MVTAPPPVVSEKAAGNFTEVPVSDTLWFVVAMFPFNVSSPPAATVIEPVGASAVSVSGALSNVRTTSRGSVGNAPPSEAVAAMVRNFRSRIAPAPSTPKVTAPRTSFACESSNRSPPEATVSVVAPVAVSTPLWVRLPLAVSDTTPPLEAAKAIEESSAIVTTLPVNASEPKFTVSVAPCPSVML